MTMLLPHIISVLELKQLQQINPRICEVTARNNELTVLFSRRTRMFRKPKIETAYFTTPSEAAANEWKRKLENHI